MTKKIFVSLPMRDRSIDDIRKEMYYLLNIADESMDDDVELIDTIWDDNPNDPDILDFGVHCLGKSITELAGADYAIFHPDWRNARGCIIEHMVCALYNVPYFDISMDYHFDDSDDTIDNTHDWDLAGQVNAEMSKVVAEAEGLTDISNDDDVEDALGFEHDNMDDLEGEPEEIDYVDDIDILEDGEYDADSE